LEDCKSLRAHEDIAESSIYCEIDDTFARRIDYTCGVLVKVHEVEYPVDQERRRHPVSSHHDKPARYIRSVEFHHSSIREFMKVEGLNILEGLSKVEGGNRPSTESKIAADFQLVLGHQCLQWLLVEDVPKYAQSIEGPNSVDVWKHVSRRAPLPNGLPSVPYFS
jgi:hypothetical protein